jgi:predicted RNase H-like HicB family nuclease
MDAGLRLDIPNYVAVVEDSGRENAVWFPDLPGCFSAGNDIDKALRNAQESLMLNAESRAKEGRALSGAAHRFGIEGRSRSRSRSARTRPWLDRVTGLHGDRDWISQVRWDRGSSASRKSSRVACSKGAAS